MEIYDPLYGRLSIPAEFAAIINSRQFRRLQHVRQLGVCHLSFIGGNHTRFEHSIGAYHLAGWLKAAVSKASFLRPNEIDRLGALLQLGALCHDIGHGPFSHMIENVLLGLGAKISHEEMGAGILFFDLQGHFGPFTKRGVEAVDIARLILHQPQDDPQIRCAEDIVSSELDVDRIDYLYRDLYFTTGLSNRGDYVVKRVQEAWHLSRHGAHLRFELTDDGVQFAEEILFTRRNNYKNIVYEPKHMAATAMFEKAVAMASEAGGPMHGLVRDLCSLPAFQLEESYRGSYTKAQALYSLVDFEAISLLQRGSTRIKGLVEAVRREQLYESRGRIVWESLHSVTQQAISDLKSEGHAFRFRRAVEREIAKLAGIEPFEVAAHIPRMPSAKFARMATHGGTKTLNDNRIISFLAEDTLRQYAVDIFVAPSVSPRNKSNVSEIVTTFFAGGELALSVS